VESAAGGRNPGIANNYLQALKGRQALQRAENIAVSPFQGSLDAGADFPGFRFASPGAKLGHRFAVRKSSNLLLYGFKSVHSEITFENCSNIPLQG
jgi:hypothetical protein